jgi:hypothetical protein
MTRSPFSFSDPKILDFINSIPDRKSLNRACFSDLIEMNNGDMIELCLMEKFPKPRPPSQDIDLEWRLRVWDSSEIVIAAASWEDTLEFNPKFVILSNGFWEKCSESKMKEFLMMRSDQLGEWLLWNLI